MKKLLSVGILILLLAGIPAANAQPLALPPDVEHNGSVWTIYPHNSSPDDPQRIREVVALANPGDTIRLAAGVFDFSEFENVYIYKDLTIEGAWDKKAGAPATTIKHGMMPLTIGRKTPFEPVEQLEIDGHTVYHITPDIYGKLSYPFMYPPYYWPYNDPAMPLYDFFDDWMPVNVTVRQLRFERPYGCAIWTGAANGESIERIQVDGMWPWDLSYEIPDSTGVAVGWLNPTVRPFVMGLHGRAYDTRLYFDTDLIKGNILVQDVRVNGDYWRIPAGEVDEAGDVVVTPFDPDDPAPPGGKWDEYVLQEVTFGYDAVGVPADMARYWVKKGYTASWLYWGDGRIWAARGTVYGVYSAWSEATMTIRKNTIRDCTLGVFFIGNGGSGDPFTAIVEDNEIVTFSGPVPFLDTSGVLALSTPMYDAYKGEYIDLEPGTNIEVRDNHIVGNYPYQGWYMSGIDIEVNGSALVEGNDVEVASSSGIALWWPTDGGQVLRNRVSGTGDYALVTYWDANHNELRANNVNNFTPAGPGPAWADPPIPPAEILLLSNGNRVIGGGNHEPGVTVLDFGTDNIITGMTRQVGRPLSAAERSTINSARDRK